MSAGKGSGSDWGATLGFGSVAIVSLLQQGGTWILTPGRHPWGPFLSLPLLASARKESRRFATALRVTPSSLRLFSFYGHEAELRVRRHNFQITPTAGSRGVK